MNSFNRTHRRPRAFTMLEMMVAMVASAFLLAGLGSVMFIARQIAYSPTAAARRAKIGRHRQPDLRRAPLRHRHHAANVANPRIRRRRPQQRRHRRKDPLRMVRHRGRSASQNRQRRNRRRRTSVGVRVRRHAPAKGENHNLNHNHRLGRNRVARQHECDHRCLSRHRHQQFRGATHLPSVVYQRPCQRNVLELHEDRRTWQAE